MTRGLACRRFFEDVVLKCQSDECLYWPFSKDRYGYGGIHHNRKRVYVHRLACELIHGPHPKGKYDAAHSCGNGHLGCCNPRHLSWKTRAQNMADKVTHGTSNRGEQSACAKLTSEQVIEIMKLKGIVSQNAMAREYGVCRGTVASIHQGKNWTWLLNPPVDNPNIGY